MLELLRKLAGDYILQLNYTFNVIEEGIDSRLRGEWHTETVQFSDLTFDTNQKMVYLHDSNSEKQDCINHIK